MSKVSVVPAPSPRQLAAIHASGWGQSFRVFQPRNLASWVFCWYLVLGAISTLRLFRPDAEAVGTATVWAFVFFGLYTLPWLWFLRRQDRWTPIPAKLLLYGFLWGGLTAAAFIALPANNALLSIYNKAVSAVFAQDWAAGLTAPFTEEPAKGIGVLLLLFMAPKIIRTPFDGFIVGAFVGLGFQILEDALYAVNRANEGFGADQFRAVLYILEARGVAGMFSHALFSAILGTGLIFLIGTSVARPHRLLGLGLILIAMVAHGVWDAAAALAGEIGLDAIIFMIVLGLIELVIILTIGRRVSGGEQTWMRELLAPEVERGTITASEVNALSGTRKERKRFVESAESLKDKKTSHQVLEAITDLAEALARSGGQETPAVVFARSEISRVRAKT